jgi:RND family efflux transporter MFP subunit
MRADLEEDLGSSVRKGRGARRFGVLALAAVLVFAGLFAVGYLPRARQQQVFASEERQADAAHRQVTITPARVSDRGSELTLPGTTQPIDETPIWARADGYLKQRLIDIGDRVAQGQLLAEIESPELDQQIRQARATLELSRASLEKARASLVQSQANQQLSSVTAGRWSTLVDRGVLSRQDGDQKQTDLAAKTADVNAARATVHVAEADVQSGEANLQRLREMQGFRRITAPFPGVITERNVDTGSLIAAGGGNNRPMFNLARIDRLRIWVSVPQTYVPSLRIGQKAAVTLAEFPGREFTGLVTRTADSLDEKTHTLLAEIQVGNDDRKLLPGMYVQVKFVLARVQPPLLAPAEAISIRPDGVHIFTVDGERKVRDHKVQVGRDYGNAVEVIAGLQRGDSVIVNPADDLREGETVETAAK